MRPYSTVQEWIKDCRANVENDQDNLILYMAEPGQGKSTLAFQHLAAIDPGFNVSRVAFTIKDFLRLSRAMPKRAAILGDELLASSSKAMYGPNIQLKDRLQVCRGKNHTMGACFPYESLDREIVDQRVRFKIKIPTWLTPSYRGDPVFKIRERIVTERYDRHRNTVNVVRWVDRGSFKFLPNSGWRWEEYRAAKDAHMDSGGEEEAEVALVKPAAAPLCSDFDGAVEWVRRGLENAKRAASVGSD